ncbi:lipase family protein [Acetobacter indonesiensis]|uniref:lipase family protein n=1 Tax=Acetobacter indonesiensis TaxID=104101 RepID=UPI0039ECC047
MKHTKTVSETSSVLPMGRIMRPSVTAKVRSGVSAARVALAGGVAALALGAVHPALAQTALPKTIEEGLKLEAEQALPITPFYTDAAPADAPSWPGGLIRAEKVTDYAIPAGMTAWRILYHSLDAERHDVVTSAFVLLPAGPVPAGGWPTVAWAHGTSGVAQPCAPSLMKDLYYGDEGLFDFPKAGLAVVATDYHGEGTPGAHQYMNKLAQGYDVIYSVAAAHAALPGVLSKQWVADGHSQGGMASWSVGEMEQQMNNPDYLGTVSVSGTVDMLDFIAPKPEEVGAPFYFPMVAYGLKARYPDFDVKIVLTKQGYEHYPLIATKACWFTGYAAYLGKSSAQIMKPNWTKVPAVQAMLKEDIMGEKPVKGPLMVLTGGGDVSVPPGGVKKTAHKACKNGIKLFFHLYPGLDHDPTMINSTQDQIAWIKDRFAGKPFEENCNTL